MSEAGLVTPDIEERPSVGLKPGAHRRVLAGHPWVYSNEVEMTAAARSLAPGSIVRVLAHDGRALGVAMFNPASLISARLLDRDPLGPRMGTHRIIRGGAWSEGPSLCRSAARDKCQPDYSVVIIGCRIVDCAV